MTSKPKLRYSRQYRNPGLGKMARMVTLHKWLNTNGRSALNIYHDLVERTNAPRRYLLTYKLSQDHLERFFAAIRVRGGHNDNPNARKFRGAYKHYLVK